MPKVDSCVLNLVLYISCSDSWYINILSDFHIVRLSSTSELIEPNVRLSSITEQFDYGGSCLSKIVLTVSLILQSH